MRVPYREYISLVPETSEFRLILRPVITVRLVGPKTEALCDALVDTGADETLLPHYMAELLGIELNEMTSQASGITGDLLTIYYGDVQLEIAIDGKSAVWKTTVGFVDFGSSEEIVVLGHGGCLDYFMATFDGENAELELIPNDLLPSD